MAMTPSELLAYFVGKGEKQQAAMEALIGELRKEITNLDGAREAAKAAGATLRLSSSEYKATVDSLVPTVARAAAEGASGAVGAAVDKAFETAGERATQALSAATGPVQQRLTDTLNSITSSEHRIDTAATWLIWKLFAVIAGGVFLIWVLGLYEVGLLMERRAALDKDLTQMRATIAELENKGGRIKIHPGGCDGRLCIEVSKKVGAGAYQNAPPHYYSSDDGSVLSVIPEGY